MLVTKGTNIVCSKNHTCGYVSEDVEDNEAITSKVIAISGGAAATRNKYVGHICAEPGCGEVVTKADADGRFRIKTARGWIGVSLP